MLDQWFLEDIDGALKRNGRFVLIDTNKTATFLRGILEKHRKRYRSLVDNILFRKILKIF